MPLLNIPTTCPMRQLRPPGVETSTTLDGIRPQSWMTLEQYGCEISCWNYGAFGTTLDMRDA